MCLQGYAERCPPYCASDRVCDRVYDGDRDVFQNVHEMYVYGQDLAVYVCGLEYVSVHDVHGGRDFRDGHDRDAFGAQSGRSGRDCASRVTQGVRY